LHAHRREDGKQIHSLSVREYDVNGGHLSHPSRHNGYRTANYGADDQPVNPYTVGYGTGLYR
jgi:hypothetical protein